jgi:DNA-binding response OmpR family regulator
MTFAKPADLVRLLLQQSDRHPIRALSAADLEGQDPHFVKTLKNLGILRERSDLWDSGDAVLDVVGGMLFETDAITGGCTRSANTLDVQVFDIDFGAICREIRSQSGLTGPPLTFLSARAVHLGRAVKSERGAEICLIRGLRPERALETINLIRGSVGGSAFVAAISLAHSDLPSAVTRQLAAMRMQVTAIDEHLGNDPEVPFALNLSRIRFAQTEAGAEARLVVDRLGKRSQFDCVELDIETRDFGVFNLLAEEAAGEGGWVRRDSIAASVRAATGRDGNEEQAERSINRLRDVFRKNVRLKDVPQNGYIETKAKVGYRLTLPGAAIQILD